MLQGITMSSQQQHSSSSRGIVRQFSRGSSSNTSGRNGGRGRNNRCVEALIVTGRLPRPRKLTDQKTHSIHRHVFTFTVKATSKRQKQRQPLPKLHQSHKVRPWHALRRLAYVAGCSTNSLCIIAHLGALHTGAPAKMSYARAALNTAAGPAAPASTTPAAGTGCSMALSLTSNT